MTERTMPPTATATIGRFSLVEKRSLMMLLSIVTAVNLVIFVEAFSAPSLNVFDRFRCTCPADVSAIQQFEPSLFTSDDSSESSAVWASVYRSSNHVILKDDFWNSMHVATTFSGSLFSSTTSSTTNLFIETTPGEQRTPPIAVARMHTSASDDNVIIIDKLQCRLKKEEINSDCDGGSEHAEALSCAIDALLLYYLHESKLDADQEFSKFHKRIRTKATLVSGVLFEKRGFQPVQEISNDMATHVSDLDGCLEMYANRATSARISPGARTSSLTIVSELAKLSRDVELAPRLSADTSSKKHGAQEDDEDYDPWGRMKRYI